MGPSPSPRIGRYDLPGVNHSPSNSLTEFQVERAPPRQYPSSSRRAMMQREEAEAADEEVLRESVSRLLAAKTRPYAVAGRIPFDPANLVLFFRSKVSALPYSR
jgi:hypothetical protein